MQRDDNGVVRALSAGWNEVDWTTIEDGDEVIITMDNGKGTYGLDNTVSGSAPSAIAFEVSDDSHLVGTDEDFSLCTWVVTLDDDGFGFARPDAGGWLGCTNANNGVRVVDDDTHRFVVDEDVNYLVHTFTSRYLGVYNSQDWRCYKNTSTNISGQTLQFWKQTDGDPTVTEYSITCNDGVSASPESAAAGEPVTLTVEPEEGYELVDLFVTYIDSEGDEKNVDLEEGDDENEYVFDMPDADVTVTARFAWAGVEGFWGNCPWEIDADGALTVHPGEGEDTGGTSPWEDHKDRITSVVFAQEGEGEDVSKVVAPADCSRLLEDLANVTSIDASGLDVSGVTDMSIMFYGCSSLTSLDLSGWDTGSVTSLYCTFDNCSKLETLAVSEWDTSKVASTEATFYGCASLEALDLTGWNTAAVTDMSTMFYGCSKLATISVGSGWSTGKVTYSGSMFTNCTSLVGGAGTTYSADHADKAYAHVDGGEEDPGYLTAKTCTVTFVDEDGTVLKTAASYDYGTPADQIVQPDTPAKAPTAQYTYEFAGWEPELARVTADATYRATYTQVARANEIVADPADATAAVGERFTLTVEATGDVSSYQWMHSRDNGATWRAVQWAGNDTDTLSYRMQEGIDGRQFKCVVRFGDDGTSAESGVATVSLPAASWRITAQPSDAAEPEGDRFTLSVTADGVASYRWQHSKDGAKWSDVTWTGHDSATLTHAMTEGLDGRMFRCVVTFDDGTAEVSEAATVTLAAPSSGRITSQPADATAEAGERFELSVEAEGAVAWRWQHSRDGAKWSDVAWSGHDAAALGYRMAESLDGRVFRCVVTFDDGTAEVSEVATVTLSVPK